MPRATAQCAPRADEAVADVVEPAALASQPARQQCRHRHRECSAGSRCAQALRLLGATALLRPWGARAALSVMPHQSDAIIMQLRGAIALEEQDLLGPSLPTGCSSLDDGPFCSRLALEGASSSYTSRHGYGGSRPSSGEFVVDGVLSTRMQVRNKGAFDWSAETFRGFSNLVSRVISDSLGSPQAITRRADGSAPSSSASSSSRPPAARTGSQCFWIRLDRLPPYEAFLPRGFSAGLPSALAATWEGLWEVSADADAAAATASGRHTERLRTPWATRLVLRTVVGYLRFAMPVVLRRVLVGIPGEYATGAEAARWGHGGMICGRRARREKWCVPLERVLAMARANEDIGREQGHAGLVYADVGNSLYAVDEIAFIAVPPGDLRVAMVEVAATLPSHPLYGITPESRMVVLLRQLPATTSSGAPGTDRIEPLMLAVSRDAAIWDVNEVLGLHMTLRAATSTVVGPKAGGAAAPQLAAGAGASTTDTEGGAMTLQSFQEILKDLRDGRIGPPPGVSVAQLRKEVEVLVKATQELQDDDVLLYGKIEALLRQKLREKALDGLIALQASWQSSSSSREHQAPSSVPPAVGPAETATQPGSQEGAAGGSASEPAEGAQQPWTDAATEAMDRAAKALEQRSSEAKDKGQQHKKPAVQVMQMDLERGTMQFSFSNKIWSLEDLASQISGGGSQQGRLQDLAAQVKEALSNLGADGGLGSADVKELQEAFKGALRGRAKSEGAEEGEDDGANGAAEEGGEAQVLSKFLKQFGKMKEALEEQMQDGDAQGQDGDGQPKMFFIPLEGLEGVDGGAQGNMLQNLLQGMQGQGMNLQDLGDAQDPLAALLAAMTGKAGLGDAGGAGDASTGDEDDSEDTLEL